MRQAIESREEELGFKLDRRRSRRQDPIIITDTDFADDIALISEEIAQAQEMVSRVEFESGRVQCPLCTCTGHIRMEHYFECSFLTGLRDIWETSYKDLNGALYKLINAAHYLKKVETFFKDNLQSKTGLISG